MKEEYSWLISRKFTVNLVLLIVQRTSDIFNSIFREISEA